MATKKKKKDTKGISVKVDAALWREVKIKAVRDGVRLQSLIEGLLRAALKERAA